MNCLEFFFVAYEVKTLNWKSYVYEHYVCTICGEHSLACNLTKIIGSLPNNEEIKNIYLYADIGHYILKHPFEFSVIAKGEPVIFDRLEA